MISPRGRIALAVALTLVTIGGTIALSIHRIQTWGRLGWAGLGYLQADLPERGVFGMKPGAVIIAYPGAPAELAGVRQGDIIRSINGIALKNSAALRQLDERIRSGSVVTYRVVRDGVERDFAVRFASPLAAPSMLATAVVNAIVAMSFVTIGLFVFIRSPGDRRAVVFYAMTVAGALSLLFSIIIGLDGSNSRGILISVDCLDGEIG